MQIGEFVALLDTSKETIRHYEDLQLLTPARRNNRREYGDQEILAFQVVRELKSMGLGLREIQFLFELKQAFGCGDRQLLLEVDRRLSEHLEALQEEEAAIRHRRLQLAKQLEEVRQAMAGSD